MSTEDESPESVVADTETRLQAQMHADYVQERVDVQDAHDRFQVRMGEERDTERVQVQAAADRFEDHVANQHEAEQVAVQRAQDRFQAHTQHDREQLEVLLQQSQRLELLGQLAGGVAHDFNNLLAVILNYAAFVTEELGSTDPQLRAALADVAQIERAASRAVELTHQLLAFARRDVTQPLVLNLNAVVVDVEHLLRRTLGADIVLTTDLASDLAPVLADAGQMEQVLMNLALNARDAMGEGGTLSIDTANVQLDQAVRLPAGSYVRLRVADTGSGMSVDVQSHVFEPFFTTKAEGAGTGLGLSTVYGIITQAEGTVTINSLPGVGTTFTILLPATQRPMEPVDAPLDYERAPQGEMVLIVEDQDALREVTRRIFLRSGYTVLTATNGLDAIELAASFSGPIHLLVTDVVMPHMLGKEVAERVAALRPGIEVLFMSGYAQPVLASQGRLDPGVHLIEKPFTAAAMIETAGRILNGHFSGFRTVGPVV